ncbi:MAG TPA: 2-oxo acid dehydrogenase subunit E2 [Polyangiaceae bacterium]|nr:2-oxo acid dehydrogenase subunit E2 [Polyangiaceae bacterium]
MDRIESVPLGLRWIDDAFAVSPVAGGFGTVLADMTNAKAALRIMRGARIPATMAHLILRACAIVLSRNPNFHQMVCNYKRLTPGRVDIGLSLAGETTYAPVVVIGEADRLPLLDLVPAVISAVDAAMEKEKVDLANMRKYLWLIPFGFLRRFFIRLMNRSLWFRRRIAGTFQVSLVPSCDTVVPLMFYTGAVLAAGSLRDRVVAIDGKPAVRPTMWLTLAADHISLDGARAGELIEAIRILLEGDELVREAREAVAAKQAAGLPAGTPDGEERAPR